MFLRLTRTIAVCARAMAVLAAVAFPVAVSAQGAPGNGRPNARSGSAAGGVVGTVDSVSPSSFAVSTSAGQKVIVTEGASTST